MKKIHKNFMLSTALMLTGLAFAIPTSALAGSNAQMHIGKRTSQPIGHYDYCRINSADCRYKTKNIRPVKLTRSRWAEMVEANTYANSIVKPVTDKQYYGVEELWVMPKTHGDCEDFALLKRKQLMKQGWPASSLLVTVVRQKNGDGHAVLTVRTDRADYVLDNLDGKIKQWNMTEYTYLKRQSAAHSGRWEDIIDSRQSVGSVQ